MSTTLDLYDPAFPHGTVDGYRSGCRGSQCGALIACRDVYRRYQGDFSFRRLVDAGMTAAEIIARDDAERTAAIERDREANRAARRAQAADERARLGRQARRRTDHKPVRAPRAAHPSRPPVERKQRRTIAPEVARLHAQGMTDTAIAAALGKHPAYVGTIRRELGLEKVVRRQARPQETTRPNRRRDIRPEVSRLHADGMTDSAIADALGVTEQWAGTVRRGLKLPAHRQPRKTRPEVAPRRDIAPDVQRLYAEGLNDIEIGAAIGANANWVGIVRRRLSLPPQPARTAPHGTNACYARGCRQPECVEAHKTYHRDYVKRRRSEGAREYHGTAYGYQLGCRGSSCPSEISCTQAMLDADRARRRAAGIPPKDLVDAAPVQTHVRDLVHAGLSIVDIAHQAGLTFAIVRKVVHSQGATRGQVRQLLASRAAAILAVPIPTQEAVRKAS